ncbi:MAG: YicC/YloC family endoribonuclease [Bacteroidota bacterium]
MIKSMTGFGKEIVDANGKSINIEIRSLNNKQLDLNIRIPSLLKEKEYELRTIVAKQAERGKVDVLIYIEHGEVSSEVNINKELVKTYYNELLELQKLTGDKDQSLLPMVLKMPDVMKVERSELNDDEFLIIKSALEKALQKFNDFRNDEGHTLCNDLLQRISIINDLLIQTEGLDLQRKTKLRERIKKNVLEFVEEQKIDQNRFEQELIYYFEKVDITEEKTRLKTHLDYFTKTINEEQNQGRKLGFITQEIGREINTIGSKANDADMQKLVVQMKDELEKIKEQSLNIL